MAEPTIEHPAVVEAQRLAAWGFNVVPAAPGERRPRIKWTRYQNERTDEMLFTWFRKRTVSETNWCIVTGRISGVVVLDCDSDEAHQAWVELLGQEVLDSTVAVTSRRGKHYYFAYPQDRISGLVNRKGPHDGGMGEWDLRCDRGIIVAPPSTHKTGSIYEWLRSPDVCGFTPLPESVVAVIDKTELGPGESDGGRAGERRSGDDGVVRSMFSYLKQHPGEGGRNNWVTQMLGHIAKRDRQMPDLYEVEAEEVWEIARGLPDSNGTGEAYGRDEYERTRESIWRAEQLKLDETGKPKISEATGWLMPNDDGYLLCQTRVKEGKVSTRSYEMWSDFNLKALGVVEDENAQRVYDVELYRPRQADRRRATLPAKTMADSKALDAWLAEYGVGIWPPDDLYPKKGSSGVRLLRYLESQNPPHFEVVDALGWYPKSNGFVSHQGVIREDGLHPFDQRKPHPRLGQGWAPYRYGFEGSYEEAQAVLREILTFHDEIVCSVFGAWWAACFLKPQIQLVASQFPFMALEAPSESGKTTGFFSMLLNLGGNTLGNTNPTQASLRDYLSGNQSGIFWIDDLNQVGHLMELLRQATAGEGAVSKKGEDKTSQVQVRLVNPVCLSGEALPIRTQKALVDRAVMLDVPSPTSRKSARDPNRLQWLDLVAMRTKTPDLSIYAGHFVARALALRDLVADLPDLVPEGASGRWGDKIAVLRMGARLLAQLSGEEFHIERVDSWALRQNDQGSENTLTLRVVPEALLFCDFPQAPMLGADNKHGVPTPAFIGKDGVVWFSPLHLAKWMDATNRGKIEQRTETENAFTQQARALGLGGDLGDWRKQFRMSGSNTKTVYWKLSEELSQMVIERAQGGRVGGAQEPLDLVYPPIQTETRQSPIRRSGVHPEQHKQGIELDLPMTPYPTDEGV